MSDFIPFPKIPRLTRDMIVTEKIDGTNASIHIDEITGEVRAASRTRWITPDNDNFGFARWVSEHMDTIREVLGPGSHFGEWFGNGIQRGYGLPVGERRFALFNVSRWSPLPAPSYGTVFVGQLPELTVVPVLYVGPFDVRSVSEIMGDLRIHGSYAAPFMNPEGVVVYHTAGNYLFKKTFDNDLGKERMNG